MDGKLCMAINGIDENLKQLNSEITRQVTD